MHEIVIKKLSWKNFFRYGNTLSWIDFEKGLSIIRGANGLGKTTIENILCFVFYGEIVRKDVKVAQLVNKRNKKGLLGEVLLDRINGDTIDTFVITRTMKPNKLVITKNGVELKDIPIDVNEYICREILGFGINMFKNVLSVSPLEVDAFLKMDAKNKRKLIETIFNLSKIEVYLKNSKIKNNEFDFKIKLLESEINNIKSNISTFESLTGGEVLDNSEAISKKEQSISFLTNEIKNEEEKVATYEAVIELKREKLAEIDSKITELNNKLSENNYNEVVGRSYFLNSEKDRVKKDFDKLKKERSSIKENYVCTECGTFIDNKEKANEHYNSITAKMDLLKEEGKNIVVEQKDLVEKINILTEIKANIAELNTNKVVFVDSINSKQMDIRISQMNISRNKSDIERQLKDIEDLKTGTISNNAKELKKKITKLNSDLSSKCLEATELKVKKESCEYLINMFSDEGIKRYLLKKFIPVFNSLINHYLIQYNLNVKVDFDEYFDYTIDAGDDVGDSYGALSGGQRNRINISVLFALNDLISMIGNFKCNTMFIDEFIDSGVDNAGLIDSIKILKEMANRSNKSIFIVSHKAGPKILNLMDHCYKVLDLSGFSIINKIEIQEEINEILEQ